nr:hypothetical protein [Tanacetum cinerariifolium]
SVTVMSDSEDSMVTYTTVSSPYEGRSEDVSPGVNGPPVMMKDPYAYVVAAFQALPPSNYVPGLEEPEQAPPSPDDVFPAEEQPLPAAASPTAESLGYIPEFDPDEDSEEDDDEDQEEDPADYPADHDDEEDDDEDPEEDPTDYPADHDDEEEPSGDDADEEDTWIDPRDVAEEEALTTLEGVNTRVTELAVVQEQDTYDIYGVMEHTQGRQTEIFQIVEALVDDSQYHYETSRLVDREARCSREAWAHSIGLSLAGHLATALDEIRALQAREQARAGAPEGASSST